MKKIVLLIVFCLLTTFTEAATFGRTTSTVDNSASIEDAQVGLVVSMDAVAGQQAVSITAYVQCTTANKLSVAALYDGTDDSLIAETPEKEVVANANPKWETWTFTTPVPLVSGKSYIISIMSEDAGGVFVVGYNAYSGDMVSRAKFSLTYNNEAYNPYVAGYTPLNDDGCLYVTYEAASDDGTISGAKLFGNVIIGGML